MNFADYQQQAAKTAIYPTKADDFSLAYLGLKLCGEANELRTASPDNIVKESGDVTWYASQIARVGDMILFIPKPGEHNLEACREGLAVFPAEIAELIGKAYRDNEGILTEHAQDLIEYRLQRILECVAGVLAVTGVSFDTMLQANLDKLASRAARNVLHGSGDDR